jgi:Cdc6-like AAA superfamily ATPase
MYESEVTQRESGELDCHTPKQNLSLHLIFLAFLGCGCILSIFVTQLSNNNHSGSIPNEPVIRDRALDAEREKVLDWLTPFDYDLQQSYISKRQHGTGQWLLDSAEFQGWLVADNQTLFCPGIPGAGKSFMTAIVIDHLHANYKRFNVAYLYCNVGQQSQQTPEGLLGSILKQLVRGQSPFPKDIKDLYDRHKDKPSRPVLKEISDVLQSVISPDSRTFIIIDALDECQNHDGCRDSLLSEVFTLQDKTRLNIFATSRPQEVQAKFSTSIVLEIRATDRDIETYLDGRISLWNTLHKNSLDDIRDMIKTELARIAGGM